METFKKCFADRTWWAVGESSAVIITTWLRKLKNKVFFFCERALYEPNLVVYFVLDFLNLRITLRFSSKSLGSKFYVAEGSGSLNEQPAIFLFFEKKSISNEH